MDHERVDAQHVGSGLSRALEDQLAGAAGALAEVGLDVTELGLDAAAALDPAGQLGVEPGRPDGQAERQQAEPEGKHEPARVGLHEGAQPSQERVLFAVHVAGGAPGLEPAAAGWPLVQASRFGLAVSLELGSLWRSGFRLGGLVGLRLISVQRIRGAADISAGLVARVAVLRAQSDLHGAE